MTIVEAHDDARYHRVQEVFKQVFQRILAGEPIRTVMLDSATAMEPWPDPRPLEIPLATIRPIGRRLTMPDDKEVIIPLLEHQRAQLARIQPTIQPLKARIPMPDGRDEVEDEVVIPLAEHATIPCSDSQVLGFWPVESHPTIESRRYLMERITPGEEGEETAEEAAEYFREQAKERKFPEVIRAVAGNLLWIAEELVRSGHRFFDGLNIPLYLQSQAALLQGKWTCEPTVDTPAQRVARDFLEYVIKNDIVPPTVEAADSASRAVKGLVKQETRCKGLPGHRPDCECATL